MLDDHLDGNGEDGEDDGEDGAKESKGRAKISQSERDQIRQEVKQAILNAAQQAEAGTLPKGVERMIKQMIDPIMPWRELLQTNLKQLKAMRLLNDKQLNIVELPMPDKVIYEDQRLPASYANFYISNQHVIVPTFRCDKDDKALQIIQDCFPKREVVGIDSSDIIWGLGSFHCLSQQEPK